MSKENNKDAALDADGKDLGKGTGNDDAPINEGSSSSSSGEGGSEGNNESSPPKNSSSSNTDVNNNNKVFISEEELSMLEKKVLGEKDESKKVVYEEALADLKAQLAVNRKEQEEAALKSEVEALKAEMESLREASKQTPGRRSFASGATSPFKKTDDGRVGIPTAELESATREFLKGKQIRR
jgi:hypothetical protein